MAVSVPETLSATSVPATLVWYCAPKWSGRHHPEGRVIRTCYVLGGVWLWGLWGCGGCGVVGLWGCGTCPAYGGQRAGLDFYLIETWLDLAGLDGTGLEWTGLSELKV